MTKTFQTYGAGNRVWVYTNLNYQVWVLVRGRGRVGWRQGSPHISIRY